MNNKAAFDAAWEFVKSNWKVTILAVIIEIALVVLGLIPLIGIIFGLLATLVVFNEQIYFGKVVMNSKSIEDVRKAAEQTDLMQFLFKYINVAIGAYLGSIVLFLIMGVVGLILFQFGLSYDMYGQPHINVLGILLILVLMVFFSVFGYIFPAIMGEIIKSDTFGDGFKKVFLIFSPNLWKKTLNKKYFLLVFIWFLIFFGISIVSELMIMTLILLPLGILGFYFLGLYNGAVFVYASNLLENQTAEENEIENNSNEEAESSTQD
jgi:hypothetical protein